MITEDYVSYETAKLLKEKGFNEICEMFYCKPHEGYLRNRKRNEWWNSDLREDMTCTCPTLQMAMKWLREVHRLDIDISIEYTPKKVYFYSIFKKTVIRDIDCLHSETNFDSYEKACEAAIRYTLENLI